MLNYLGIKSTGIHDLIYGAFFITHVGQLGIARAKTDAGDIAADQRDGVGAEIPEGEILGCAAKDLFEGIYAGLGQVMIAGDFPGGMQRAVDDGFASPGSAVDGVDLPGSVLIPDDAFNFSLKGGLILADHCAAVEIDLTFVWGLR